MLRQASCGFGALAFSALLNQESRASQSISIGRPHYRPKAKSVIFLFMEGGVSQVDSFDYKPMLEKYHGRKPNEVIGKLEKTQFDEIGNVFKSPWAFKRRGQCGAWVSELFPNIAMLMDEITVLRSMTSNFPEHTSANYFLHSGSGLQGRPSMGAWATYGLGSASKNLPGFIVLNGGQIPSGGLDNFSSGFLPASFQGSLLNAKGTPLSNINPREKKSGLQEKKQNLLRKLNNEGIALAGKHDALESAIRNFELAARMQVAIPELTELRGESASTKNMYGLNAKYEHTRTYARQCLMARRMVERGVRFIELTIPMVDGYSRWDAHGNLIVNHGNNARAVDQPIAGLIKDLKQRGLLEETLVVWSGEFGRTPFAQGSEGRDHNQYGFSLWMAGGGIQKGVTYGATDDWGYKVAENPVQIHDLHAIILHLMGIDHEKLIYRFSGRDIRLTDVHGKLIPQILT
tara:strand:+ start:928 stop:2307 length:1380 start_codon:yes stop_codon:yes gene_type:complete